MTNIYNIPNEVINNAPIEANEPECPYCTGTNTKFIDFEFSDIDDLTHERHFCFDCVTDFTVSYHPIPFLPKHETRVKEHSCSQNSR